MIIPVPALSLVCSLTPPKKLCTSSTLIFVIETMDGITFSTMSETSDVTTLEVRDSVALLFTAFDVSDELCEESSSPRILFPIMFDVRNVALETTPNRSASPVTATAFGIFLRGFFSFGGCGSCCGCCEY